MEIEKSGSSLEAAAGRWKRFRERGDDYRAGRVADEICEALSALIGKLCRPHLERNRSIERLAIENVARIAILGALERYQPVSGGATFKTFAHTTISGSLMNYVRDECGSIIHEPAEVKDNRRKVRQSADQLQAHGLPVTPEALSQATKLSDRQVAAILTTESATAAVASLDQSSDVFAYHASFSWLPGVETRLALEQPLKHLPADLLAVIEQRFYEGKTLEEVGKSLGITREAVRLREQKALARLRRILEHSDPLDTPPPALNRQLTEANIDKLGEPHRTVLQGYYQEARTHREIGEQLGLSSDAVCDIRRRGLETLQHLLSA